MAEMLTVTNERVDDIPLLLAQQERMGLPALLDEHFPTHGQWQGLRLGWVVAGWLTHILSEADHRLNRVQSWAEKRLATLSRGIGQAVQALDFSDDRLAEVWRALSDDARWEAFERALNRRLLRVYDLKPGRVWLDSTAASGYWTVTSGGCSSLGIAKTGGPTCPR